MVLLSARETRRRAALALLGASEAGQMEFKRSVQRVALCISCWLHVTFFSQT